MIIEMESRNATHETYLSPCDLCHSPCVTDDLTFCRDCESHYCQRCLCGCNVPDDAVLILKARQYFDCTDASLVLISDTGLYFAHSGASRFFTAHALKRNQRLSDVLTAPFAAIHESLAVGLFQEARSEVHQVESFGQRWIVSIDTMPEQFRYGYDLSVTRITAIQ